MNVFLFLVTVSGCATRPTPLSDVLVVPAVVDVVEHRVVPAKVRGAADTGHVMARIRATELSHAILKPWLVHAPNVYELRIHDNVSDAVRRTMSRDVVLTIEDGEIVGVREGAR
jgi:hypothetical protein